MNLANVIDKKLANSLFLICVDSDGSSTKYTYKNLDDQSSWFARSLLKRGLTQGDAIAILSNNSFEYVVCYYGALKAGIVAVLINNKMSNTEIDYVLNDSGSKILFSEDERVFQIPTIKMYEIKDFYDEGDFDTIQLEESAHAVCMYTSGSTGIPKGVVYSHGQHYWVINKHSQEENPVDKFRKVKTLIITPLYHLNGLAGFEIQIKKGNVIVTLSKFCLLYTSPSPRDRQKSRMPSSA